MFRNYCFILPALLCALFTSCQNEARWYPAADVTVASQYEYIDQNTGAAQLAVTCVIHNTGDTAINEGCVTLKAQTDKREYLQTITVSMKIIPDGKIAVNATFAYLENTERLKTGGVTIFADYFN